MYLASFLSAGGEMGALTRSFPWGETPVGPIDTWPQSLRTTLATVLRSRSPMCLWWGPESICFYNDAFPSGIGVDGQHPLMLGLPGPEAWPEIWDTIGPQITHVLEKGESTSSEDIALKVFRDGVIEDTWWTFNYSPVVGEGDRICGVLVTGLETTAKFNSQSILKERADQLEQVIVSGRESQRQILELFEEAPVAIATLDSHQDMRFVTANRFYGQLVGRLPSELVGKPLLKALPEIQGRGFDDLLRDVAASGKPYTAYEVPVELKRGNGLEVVYVNFSYIPRWDADKKVNGILVTATDVTYQVQARQAIADNEALFRSLIEAAPFPIGVYVGEDMRIVHANPAIITIYGKGPDVIGKKYLELLPELLQQGIGEEMHAVYKSGRPFYSNTRRVDIDANGATVSYYFKYNFIPLFDPAGKVFGILNTGVDVTELELSRQRAEQAETNFRSAAELAELANWSIDLPNRVLHLSPRLKEWTGISEEAVPLAYFLQHIPQDFARDATSAYEQAFSSNGKMLLDIEHPLKDGRSAHGRYVHVRGQLLRDDSGTPIRLTGTAQDITPQRAVQWELERQVAERTAELADLNAALQASNGQLEETIADLKYSNDELSQYAYVTSHDLQEPLRKIRIFSSMLREKVSLGEEADVILTKINKSAVRMTQLIQDLLGFSKLLGTAGSMQPVDLTQTISTVLEDLELAIADKQASVKMEFLPVVGGIQFQLNQLFHNLIGNALKFSDPQRTPEIRIFARQLSSDEVSAFIPNAGRNLYYEISIADNGIGFERQYYAHVFELFKQLHPRDAYSGSGIGLAICRRIVTNHRGHIYATSIPGEGSTFYVLLPA